jgi:hypothetical protein
VSFEANAKSLRRSGIAKTGQDRGDFGRISINQTAKCETALMLGS